MPYCTGSVAVSHQHSTPWFDGQDARGVTHGVPPTEPHRERRERGQQRAQRAHQGQIQGDHPVPGPQGSDHGYHSTLQ